MAYIKLENNLVIQKQPNPQDGFIEAPDDVVCGMVKNGDGYVVPPKVESSEERIQELKQLLKDSDYVALSDYDKEKPELLKQRQEWRNELRNLENV
jgi:hypothetical protein